MNRRSFLETLAKAAAGFTILPSATTYARTWKRSRHLWVIEWTDVNVGFEKDEAIDTDYQCVMVPPEKGIVKSVGYIYNFSIPTVNHIDEETWLRLANPVLS